MLMPSVAGPVVSTLTVSEAGFDAVSISSEISGLGGEPSLAATLAPTYGGDVVVGERSEPLPLAFTNVAFNPVKIARISVQGSHPDDFQISLDECSRTTLDACLLYTSPSPRDRTRYRMPSSA